MKKAHFVIIVIIFLIVYSCYVLLANFKVDNYSDIIVAVTFFFTLFTGFFISRQNDRYTAIAQEIANTDGSFSLLYRIAGAVPSVQKKARDALHEHYTKIVKTNDWAYHITHPSDTITRIFNAYSQVSEEDAEKLNRFSDAHGGAFDQVQNSRKQMIVLYRQKLLPLHWVLVYLLTFLMLVSFDFIPSSLPLITFMKIIFGLTIVFVVLLLKELDDLSLFGKDFNRSSAEDIFRIINEQDTKELA